MSAASPRIALIPMGIKYHNSFLYSSPILGKRIESYFMQYDMYKGYLGLCENDIPITLYTPL